MSKWHWAMGAFAIGVSAWLGITKKSDETLPSAVIPQNARSSPQRSHSTEAKDRQSSVHNSSYLDGANSAATETARREVLAQLLDQSVFGVPPLDGLQALFRNWFEANPDQAIAAAAGIKDQQLRCLCLLEGVAVLANQPAKLVFILNEALQDKNAKYSFAVKSCGRLAGINPDIALSLLQEKSFAPYRKDSLQELFASLAKQDWSNFQTIKGLAGKLTDPRERDFALKQAVSTAPYKVNLNDYAELLRFTKDPDVLSLAFSGFSAATIRTRGVDAYLQDIRSMEIPNESRKQALSDCLKVSTESGGSLDAALDKLKGSPLWAEGKNEGDVSLVLLSRWPASEAMRFAGGLEESNPQKADAVGFVAEYLVKQDANEAAKWIAELPPGRNRDRALQPLLSYLGRQHETESLANWKKLLSIQAK